MELSLKTALFKRELKVALHDLLILCGLDHAYQSVSTNGAQRDSDLTLDIEGIEHVSDGSGSLHSFGDSQEEEISPIQREDSATTVYRSCLLLTFESRSRISMTFPRQSSRNITTVKQMILKMF